MKCIHFCVKKKLIRSSYVSKIFTDVTSLTSATGPFVCFRAGKLRSQFMQFYSQGIKTSVKQYFGFKLLLKIKIISCLLIFDMSTSNMKLIVDFWEQWPNQMSPS